MLVWLGWRRYNYNTVFSYSILANHELAQGDLNETQEI
jgi:hypothetical protein